MTLKVKTGIYVLNTTNSYYYWLFNVNKGILWKAYRNNYDIKGCIEITTPVLIIEHDSYNLITKIVADKYSGTLSRFDLNDFFNEWQFYKE